MNKDEVARLKEIDNTLKALRPTLDPWATAMGGVRRGNSLLLARVDASQDDLDFVVAARTDFEWVVRYALEMQHRLESWEK